MKTKGIPWVLEHTSSWGLAKTIEMADKRLKRHNWYAVGIRLQGKEDWAYMNYTDSKTESKITGKHKRLPKWAKVKLPMEGNPI